MPATDNNNTRIRWKSRRQLGRHPAMPELRRLLLASGSLTRQLQRRCARPLQLQLLTQQWQRPWQEEQLFLGLAQGRYALVREVCMACGDTPWLYARTLLPPGALRGSARRFTTIGQRPLGALLFGAPGRLQIRRIRRDYACLPANSPLYCHIAALLPETASENLWARRSLYRSRVIQFAIIEVFLPAMCDGTGQ